jgi:hypothetical protein
MSTSRQRARALIQRPQHIEPVPALETIVTPTAGPEMRQLNIAQDAPDLRDRVYTPSLLSLRPSLLPEALWLAEAPSAIATDAAARHLRVACRNQGGGPTCAGHALAGLIDILRLGPDPAETVDPCSGRMLYELARQRDDRTSEGGVLSLRNVIKAFYHNGVCLRSARPDNEDAGSSAAWATQARQITLGAYYRLDGVLNDYHAALNEVGAIYASAHIHKGWTKPESNVGVIGRADDDGGGHAFVIVGYTDKGFLVLNSWGPDWGRYGGYPGIALWPYEDWAENLLDAWVLRLGVSTPNAFAYTIGPVGMATGLAGTPPRLAASAPCFTIANHYAHFDDGQHVATGNYPSSETHVDQACTAIANWSRGNREARRKVLVWCYGGTDGLTDIASFIASSKSFWLDQGIYPFNIVWCSDFVDNTSAVFEQLFETAYAKLGTTGTDLDLMIERTARGIGRAFWRDVKATAYYATASRPPFERATSDKHGAIACALTKLLRKGTDAGLEVHIVADGVGALLFGRYLQAHPATARQLASVTLIAPAVQRAEFKRLYAAVLKSADGGDAKLVHVIRPTEAFESRINMGLYGKSPLHLIANSFEDRTAGAAPVFIGMADGGSMPDRTGLVTLAADRNLPDQLTFQSLTRNSSVLAWIRAHVLGQCPGPRIPPLTLRTRP